MLDLVATEISVLKIQFLKLKQLGNDFFSKSHFYGEGFVIDNKLVWGVQIIILFIEKRKQSIYGIRDHTAIKTQQFFTHVFNGKDFLKMTCLLLF